MLVTLFCHVPISIHTLIDVNSLFDNCIWVFFGNLFNINSSLLAANQHWTLKGKGTCLKLHITVNMFLLLASIRLSS